MFEQFLTLQNLTITMIIIAVLAFTVVFCVFAFLFYMAKRVYRIKVEVQKKMGMGEIGFSDWARIIEKSGSRQLYLLKSRLFLPVPSNRYVIPYAGFFRKNLIRYKVDSLNQWHPMEPVFAEGRWQFAVNLQVQKEAFALRFMNAGDFLRPKENWWVKNAPLIAMLVFIVITATMVTYSLYENAKSVSSAAGVVSQAESINQQQTRLMEMMMNYFVGNPVNTTIVNSQGGIASQGVVVPKSYLPSLPGTGGG